MPIAPQTANDLGSLERGNATADSKKHVQGLRHFRPFIEGDRYLSVARRVRQMAGTLDRFKQGC
jgi:hypothetical protein